MARNEDTWVEIPNEDQNELPQSSMVRNNPEEDDDERRLQ